MSAIGQEDFARLRDLLPFDNLAAVNEAATGFDVQESCDRIRALLPLAGVPTWDELVERWGPTTMQYQAADAADDLAQSQEELDWVADAPAQEGGN